MQISFPWLAPKMVNGNHTYFSVMVGNTDHEVEITDTVVNLSDFITFSMSIPDSEFVGGIAPVDIRAHYTDPQYGCETDFTTTISVP